MAPLTLFYSWQMDRSTKVCRDFIRRALDEAAAILALNDDIALKIDSDTQDVPGTPAITETILGKIRDCDIFLADMTFVAEAGGKHIPNPNVMGEYGYALRDKGTRRILLVMNEAYGLADKLPFDLHHLRHPEGYAIGVDVADGARRAARTDLGRRLADYIGLIANRSKPRSREPKQSAPKRSRTFGGARCRPAPSTIGQRSCPRRRWSFTCSRPQSSPQRNLNRARLNRRAAISRSTTMRTLSKARTGIIGGRMGPSAPSLMAPIRKRVGTAACFSPAWWNGS